MLQPIIVFKTFSGTGVGFTDVAKARSFVAIILNKHEQPLDKKSVAALKDAQQFSWREEIQNHFHRLVCHYGGCLQAGIKLTLAGFSERTIENHQFMTYLSENIQWALESRALNIEWEKKLVGIGKGSELNYFFDKYQNIRALYESQLELSACRDRPKE
ncbi:MAG: hypothetical protein FWC61_02110 [Proteobacteria bacterium]|nr:hypothetical protein [Pseudomonadota bacterium]